MINRIVNNRLKFVLKIITFTILLLTIVYTAYMLFASSFPYNPTTCDAIISIIMTVCCIVYGWCIMDLYDKYNKLNNKH